MHTKRKPSKKDKDSPQNTKKYLQRKRHKEFISKTAHAAQDQKYIQTKKEKKRAKDQNGYFSEKSLQIADRHMKNAQHHEMLQKPVLEKLSIRLEELENSGLLRQWAQRSYHSKL